jgi:pimeloyl-ACP methyl ester carboxylesterase
MWVERDDVRINYEIIGDGPTVVLQTGGAGDGGMWKEHLRYLSDFRVVLLDHRGRGASSRPSGLTAHSMSHYVDVAVAVIEASSTEPVGFVGYSAGAQVGYALAASHSDLIASLVGLGVIWEPDPDPGGDAELEEYVDLLRTTGMAGLVTEVETEEGIELPGWLRDQFLSTDAEMFALNLEAWRDWTAPPLFSQIGCPTLLVAGALEDPSHLNELAATKIRRAEAHWLPVLGHVGAFLAAREQCEFIVPHLRATMSAFPVQDNWLVQRHRGSRRIAD